MRLLVVLLPLVLMAGTADGPADRSFPHEFTGLKFRLETADLDATVAFYGDLLGLEVVDRWTGDGDAGVILALEGIEGRAFLEFGRAASPSNGAASVQLRVDDMAGFLQRIAGRWDVEGPEARPWGSQYAYLRDPSGVQVMVYEGTV